MIINKNSNHSQPLKTRLHYEWWVNWFEEVQQYKTLFTVRLNIRVINDVRTAMRPLELSGNIVFDIEYSIVQQTGSLIIQAVYGVTAVTRQ